MIDHEEDLKEEAPARALFRNNLVFITKMVFPRKGKTTAVERATDEIRTRDLTITNRLLYQLSHGGNVSRRDYKGL
jgi:hypothetical protein